MDMEEDFIDTLIREQIYVEDSKDELWQIAKNGRTSESDPNDIEGRMKQKITTRMKKNSTTGRKQ